MKRIYLDMCALGRPYDDQNQARIRMETSAIHLILNAVRAGGFEMIVSSVHDIELSADRNVNRQSHLKLLLEKLGSRFEVKGESARMRTLELRQQSLGIADAAHLALAEQSLAEFVTVDDRLIKRYNRNQSRIWCGTPVAFCEKEDLT